MASAALSWGRKVPGEPPALGGLNMANLIISSGPGRVGQLGSEVALGQPVVPLDVGEHGQALDAARGAGAVERGDDGLAVEGLALSRTTAWCRRHAVSPWRVICRRSTSGSVGRSS